MFRRSADNEMEATHMNLKKLLSMVLAMLLALGTVAALAEEEVELQAQLDAANARIEELEAAVELYRPY